VWEGNVCTRRDAWQAEPPGFCGWLVQRLCRMMVLFSLPWGSAMGIAVCNRFWFLIFPSQPLSARIGNFWFNVWMFYGTGLCWSVWVLLVKWGYFGRAKEGSYHPSVLENSMRWALSYWNGLASCLLWSHFRFSIFHVWNRLLGAHISSSAIVVNYFVSHPADVDLVEVMPNARLSNVIMVPYNDKAHVRKKIIVNEAAELGLYAVLHSGCKIEAGAKVNAFVFIEAERVVKENHTVNRFSEYPHWRKVIGIVNGANANSLDIPNMATASGFLTTVLMFLLEISAAATPWLNIWFSYFVYRTMHYVTKSMMLTLFVTVWVTVFSTIIVTALLHRVWFTLYSSKPSSQMGKTCLLLLWRWIFQQFFVFQLGVYICGGTVCLNLVLSIAGSKVDPTAKVFSIILIDWSLHKIGAMAVMNETARPLGHVMDNNELVFERSELADFACLYPFATLLQGQKVDAHSRVGSFMV